MIDPDPSDEALRSAHLVTLFDPRAPGWTLVLVDAVDLGSFRKRTWNVVDIPVDSTSPEAIQRWREWVKRARQPQ